MGLLGMGKDRHGDARTTHNPTIMRISSLLLDQATFL